MMSANVHTSKKFTRMCFEKSEVTSADIKKKIIMVMSKHLTHFCYPDLASCDVTDGVHA